MEVVCNILLIVMFVSASCGADRNFDFLVRKNSEIGSRKFNSPSYNPGLIKHIVMFKYKPSVKREQKEEAERRFILLKQSKRPGANAGYIIDIVAGQQNSGEKASMGFEQAFIVTFGSEGDRNYYVGSLIADVSPHYDKLHEGSKKLVGPLLVEQNGVLVLFF